MKKIIFKVTTCLFLIGMVASCSNDADNDVIVNDTPASGKEFSTERSDVWDGVLAEEVTPGVYEITADEDILLTDLEEILAKEGDRVNLRSLSIQLKTAVNDATHTTYFLIGSNNMGTSIGVALQVSAPGELSMDTSLIGVSATSTSCRGCASGCNLSYLRIDGKNRPYCNENGCIDDCQKSESNAL